MFKSKFEATIATMLTSIGSSILLMVFSIIYNKYLISIYGSSVNGLISTLTQLVALFSIVEGGATTAAVVAVYEPFVNKDESKINNIIYTVNIYFRKIALCFGGLSLICGAVYFMIVDSPLSYENTILMLLLTIFSTMVSIGVNSKFIVLLSGSNKSYIVNLVYMLSKTITWIATIVLMVNESNIILVYCVHGFNTIFDGLFLKLCIRRIFPNYRCCGSYNTRLLKGTKDVLFQKIASSVFSSTDLILISAFISFDIASVYNTYNLIFTAGFSIFNAISVSPMNSFGHLLNSKNKEAYYLFFVYQKIVQTLSSVFLVSLGVAIIPFLKLYTQDVIDVDYIIPSLVFLFYTYYYFKLDNAPFGMLLNVTGRFKQQNIQCGLSAIINIVLSVALLPYWGIQGVVFGSVCGVAIILIGNIYQTLKILSVNQSKKCILVLFINYVLGLGIIHFFNQINCEISSYVTWVGYGVLVFFCIGISYMIINFVLDRKIMMSSIKYLKNKIISFVKNK